MAKRYRKAYLEITNQCNLRCSFCIWHHRPPRRMSPEEFAQVLRQVEPLAEMIYLHLMGEPLSHPQLGEILELCRQTGLPMNLTTNGTLLEQQAPLLLHNPVIRRVSISLHSFEGNGGVDPTRYLEGVCRFLEQAQDGGPLCEVRLWNLEGEEGRQNRRMLDYLQQRLGLEPVVLPEKPGSVVLRPRLFLGLARRFDWPSLSAQDLGPDRFCRGLRDQFGVLSDGTVVPCCLDSEGTIALGNLFEQPLADILQSPRAKALYDGFSCRRAVEPLCRRCGYSTRF